LCSESGWKRSPSASCIRGRGGRALQISEGDRDRFTLP